MAKFRVGSFSVEDVTEQPRINYHQLTLPEKIIWHAKRRHWTMVESHIMQACNSYKQKHADFASLKDSETGLTLLMLACKGNQIRLTEILSKNCQKLNEFSKDGLTALHYSAHESNVDLVQLLLSRGADPLMRTLHENSLPLHLSCQRNGGSMAVTTVLLKWIPQKYRLESDKNGYLPICYAVLFGNVPLIRLLFTHLCAEQAEWKEAGTGNTLLHLATIRHDVDTVKALLIDGKMDPDIQNAAGKTPMHIAAENSDIALLRTLHQVGRASANLQDRQDATPCHVAAKIGETALMTYMIDRIDADCLMRTKDGSTLMHMSAYLGNDETALALIVRGAPLHMPNKDKMTPLHLAAQYGHINVARKLLRHGAPIGAKTKAGYTALHLAVLHNQPEFVELLIGFGATIDMKGGPHMETPLHSASRQADGYDCAKMLLMSGADVNATNKETGESPLHVVCRHGYLKMVNLFLEEGANVQLVSSRGESALHIAVRHSHYKIAKALLKHTPGKMKAELLVNMANSEGETALHMACELPAFDGESIARLLLEHGADTLATTKLTLEIPLHYAARCNGVEVMLELGKYMVTEYHSVVNRQSKNGWSPLLTGAYYGHQDVVKLLLDKEVRADVFDEHGLGALHLAAAQGFIRCCEILLSRKAFVNAKSKLGITPLHLAAENGYFKLVQRLIKVYGATVDALSLAKKTPLHLASENGHLRVVQVLVSLKANVKARDAIVGLPIHLAAKHNHHEVVKFFLGAHPELAFLSTTQDGMLCSHLAAASGSIAVIRELMRFKKSVVIGTKSRDTRSLPIHMAAWHGNSEVVRLLIDAGASPYEENVDGMTTIHVAALSGHVIVLTSVRSLGISCNVISEMNGLSPIHVAAFYGKPEAVRELFTDIPADIRTAGVSGSNFSMEDKMLERLISIDYGFTALHFAAFAGQDAVVRLLLNTYGVDVEAVSAKTGTTAMHLAAINGHLTVCSLILAKSPNQLTVCDNAGMTPLMFAAQNGHCEMVTNFVGQGENVNSSDNLGWSPLLFAARFGKLDVVALLIELGGSSSHASHNGKTPLSLAAASGHIDVFYFLLKRNFDADALLKDDEFVFDLMICGRANKQQSIEEFAIVSQSPLSTAATLTRRFRQLAMTNKQYSKELIAAGRYCEKMCATLMEIAVTHSSAAAILQAIDSQGRQVIDVMLDDGLKTVMAKASVQRYLTDVWWDGNLGWSNTQLFCLFLVFLLCPPVMAYFVLPLPHKYHRIPVIRFIGYVVSHLTFIGVLIITVVIPIYPNSTRTTFLPTWNEILLLLWLGGNLTAELTNPSGYAQTRSLRSIVFACSAIAMALQVVAVFINDMDSYEADILMYIRNLILSLPVLLSVIMCLDFTHLNHRFGPMIIIMQYMIEEAEMLAIMLIVFFVGFWLQLNTIYTPICPDVDIELTEDCICNLRVPHGCPAPNIWTRSELEPGCRANYEVLSALTTNLQLLWMGLFHHGDYLWQTFVRNSSDFAVVMTRIQFAIFHVVMVLIMLTLLIAVSAEVYERMHRRSDLEWKFGRAKLIRGMIKTAPTPSPLNLFVKPFMYMKALIKFRKNMCLSMSQAAYNLMLIEDAAGVFDGGEDGEPGANVHVQLTAAVPKTPFTSTSSAVIGKFSFGGRFNKLLEHIFSPDTTTNNNEQVFSPDHEHDSEMRGISFYKRGHQHAQLKDVVNWELIVSRYREIRAEGADEEDTIIQDVGLSISEMEDWQRALWYEMEEMEDEDQKRERRTWLIEEFNSVIKT